MYSLKSRFFPEFIGIYHLPLPCLLRDKGIETLSSLRTAQIWFKKDAKISPDISLKTSVNDSTTLPDGCFN